VEVAAVAEEVLEALEEVVQEVIAAVQEVTQEVLLAVVQGVILINIMDIIVHLPEQIFM
jgi:hypothetical protein